MKHIIKKIEYITGDIREVFTMNLETDNIEQTRRELIEVTPCDRILFVYETIN